MPRRFSAVLSRFSAQKIAGESREMSAEVIDVSREGIGLLVSERFDRDAYLRITLIMDEAQGLAAIGRRWVTEGVVRSCAAQDENLFKIGVVLRERTGKEREDWQELVTKWSAKIL